MKINVILLGGGSGERLGAAIPKAFVNFRDEPMFLSSLKVFEAHPEIDEIILVFPKEKVQAGKILSRSFRKVRAVIAGGATRLKSLENGFKKITGADFVLVHNAANPLVSVQEISDCIRTAKKSGAAGVGIAASSTVKLVQENKILQTLPRSEIYMMETPQVLRKDLLEQGLKRAKQLKLEITDDVQLAEILGIQPVVVSASAQNRKVTSREDLERLMSPTPQPPLSGGLYRVGLGQDSHRFSVKKKALYLGGVKISLDGGLLANSDGDVILHALTNALSSAVGGGSVSNYADKLCESGVKNSSLYIEKVLKLIESKKFAIENVSIALEAARPKLEKHFPKIKKSLARILSVHEDCVGITATSGEGLTEFGRGEGVQCFAIVLLKQY